MSPRGGIGTCNRRPRTSRAVGPFAVGLSVLSRTRGRRQGGCNSAIAVWPVPEPRMDANPGGLLSVDAVPRNALHLVRPARVVLETSGRGLGTSGCASAPDTRRLPASPQRSTPSSRRRPAAPALRCCRPTATRLTARRCDPWCWHWARNQLCQRDRRKLVHERTLPSDSRTAARCSTSPRWPARASRCSCRPASDCCGAAPRPPARTPGSPGRASPGRSRPDSPGRTARC